MLYKIIKDKFFRANRKPIRKVDIFFICQLSETKLRVIKCAHTIARRVEFLEAKTQESSALADKETLSFNLGRILKELDFRGNLLIASLPRAQATCRYLKIPSKIPVEVDQIASLQAPRYLPYQANELITAYQPILIDKDGYTHINLFIAHRDIIEDYIKIFKKLNVKNYSLFLSSIGLLNLYYTVNPQINSSAILIDIDTDQAEIAIVDKDNFFFSRSFKVSRNLPGWENIIAGEISKTRNAYLKDTSYKDAEKIVIFGSPDNFQGLSEIVKQQTIIPVEVFPYWQRLSFPQALLNQVSGPSGSYANLVGLGLKSIPESLSLLPPGIRSQKRNSIKAREKLRMVYFLSCIVIIFALGILKNIDNKARFLGYIKAELSNVEKDARSIGELQERIEFVEKSHQKKPSALDILYELHQIIPAEVVLTSFSYDDSGQIVLRGQTPQMNNVFEFVTQLEKSAVFRGFEIKVKYASNKKSTLGELIDFEIGGAKK
ncbi:MAG: PilN domain-containing protein [Candidatus Omnitrophica bacterium]|nr:PilN domain-containing protein [Candidatus Omnitrophota bacterium]